MHATFDTVPLAQAVATALLPMEVSPAEGRGPVAAIASRSFGGIRLSVVETPELHASRGPARLEADAERRVAVSYQLDGLMRIEQGGVATTARPGEFSVFDWESPFSLTASRGQRAVVLRLPPEAMLVPPELFRGRVSPGIRPAAGLGAAAAAFFTGLAARVHRLHGDAGERVVRSGVELACAVLAEHARADRRGAGRSPEFVRACDFIEANLADPGLGAARVAEALFVSVRQLHKVFQAEGATVSRWIRDRRLERCRAMLADPGRRSMSVGDVGAAWGFFNRAHFSRSYRAAYGASPREHRAASSGRR